MKKSFLFVVVTVVLLALGGCLYIVPIPVPITEGMLEPLIVELPAGVVPSGYYWGQAEIPSFDEILEQAQKHSPIQIPDNFRITNIDLNAKVVWSVGNADPIDLTFYISRAPLQDLIDLIIEPDTLQEYKLFDDTVFPGENIFNIKSSDSSPLTMILEILNGGTAEEISWLANLAYNSGEASTLTIYLTGTVWVKRFVE